MKIKGYIELSEVVTAVFIDGLFIRRKFVEMDSDIPAFNEWDDSDNDVTIVGEEYGTKNPNNNDEDDDIPNEAPPKLIDAMEMVRRLHILASTQHPELHSLVSQLDSQLTQLFIDSKGVKQTKINDYFSKN